MYIASRPQGAQTWITQLTCKQHHACFYPSFLVHQMAPPRTLVITSSCSLLLIYRSRKDERLSWPSWLTYSGRFTHISGHPSAVGRAQNRESSPVKDQRSTAAPRNQRRKANINSTVYCYNGAQWYKQFLQVGWQDRALILLGLALYLWTTSWSTWYYIQYDSVHMIRLEDTVYLTCSKKLTDSQLSLPHGTNKNVKEKLQNKLNSMISPVQSMISPVHIHICKKICYILHFTLSWD